jgi:hypothetical protein
MDKLEEYIRKNREELDIYNTPSGTWRSIKKELQRKKSPAMRWLSIAAMLVVILGSGIALIKYANWSDETENQMSEFSDMKLSNPQLQETEIYYNNLVNSLYKEATPMLTANPEIGRELTSDMFHLDSICSDIKRDLKDNIDNQEVVEALIQNYRIKIRLLEDMLLILKESEDIQEKSLHHEL